MSLETIDLPISITTGREDPIEELFNPVLENAETYDIAVGYFTTGWLADTAEGFAKFALSGGTSRWVVSPELDERDAACIIKSTSEEHILRDYRERKLWDVVKGLQNDTREELCALISSRVLQFRICAPRKNRGGLFHAKIGLATDGDGNKVAFSGSYNLTAAAKSNWEHIDIFRSNDTKELKRIEKMEFEFKELWENKDKKYEVFKPSDDLVQLIKKESGSQVRTYIAARPSKQSDPSPSLELRDYQKAAIEAWGNNQGRGSFVMATGTGKTITALATIQKLKSIVVDNKKKPLVIVIVLPLKHLLDQWYLEAKEFGFDPIKCYESSDVWRKKLAERMGGLKVTGSGYVMAFVTNSTFGMESFQAEIKKISSDFMLVADEAHNLGSEKYIDLLPSNANMRLALSATPDRHNDEAGTKALFEYFGAPVIEFSLGDAIEQGFLTPYAYHPHLCLMSENEYDHYLELTELIAVEADKSSLKGERTKEYNRLIGKRTDLISGVVSKLEVLEELLKKQIRDQGAISHSLIYCGSRRGEDNQRYIEKTVKLIGGLGIKVRKFTADESLDDRREILTLFSSGELEAIAAIKCLDEGVDVPATRFAYILASTSNPREYIQRRGRVLRLSAGKKEAVIHDFLVGPPASREIDNLMITVELERAREFADLANNKVECGKVIQELADEYGVEI